MSIAPPETQSRSVQCMEIWGGNEAIDSALSITGIDAWVYSRPVAGHASGGDVHYVSMCGGGKIARFAVMDVSGHGASVSHLAVKLRALMRKHINRLDQAGFASALNREFTELGGGDKYATAVLTSYFAPTDHLVVLNAGHPPPLWYRSSSATWELLEPQVSGHVERLANIPLGIIEPTDYEQFAVKLDPADLILIYTDAVVEASCESGELLGTQGLLRLASEIDVSRPDEFCRRLLEKVSRWRGDRPSEDDVTLILLHHNAADPPGLSVGETVRVIAKMLGLMKV